MASPQGGQIAIAMRLRNQLQSVYKMDPLRNEVQGRRGDCWGPLAVRTQAGERTGGGGTGAHCACAAVGCAVRTRDSDRVAKRWTKTPARLVSLTALGLPRERRVGRVREKRAPAVRGALCWAEGELISPTPFHDLSPVTGTAPELGSAEVRWGGFARPVRSD